MGAPATGRDARAIVAMRDLERSVISAIYAFGGAYSYHHRQLRRGGDDTPANLILVTGTGTTGEHGWIHHHQDVAELVGLIVPQWGTPAEHPIYRRDPFGIGWDWFLQTPDGQLEWFANAEDHVAVLFGKDRTDVDAALTTYRHVVAESRAGAL